jgi:hypothetical protein
MSSPFSRVFLSSSLLSRSFPSVRSFSRSFSVDHSLTPSPASSSAAVGGLIRPAVRPSEAPPAESEVDFGEEYLLNERKKKFRTRFFVSAVGLSVLAAAWEQSEQPIESYYLKSPLANVDKPEAAFAKKLIKLYGLDSEQEE